MSMQLRANKSLRVFSSLAFATALVFGPCVGVCTTTGLSASPAHRSHPTDKQQGHCARHGHHEHSAGCPNCLQNFLQAPEAKGSAAKALLVPAYHLLAVLPADPFVWRGLPRNSFPRAALGLHGPFPPLPAYCLNCSYLE